MKAQVLDIVQTPILRLDVAGLNILTARASRLVGHTVVDPLHLTLARFDDLGLTPKPIELQMPDFVIELQPTLWRVWSDAKETCIALVSPATQVDLTRYTVQCLLQLNLPRIALDPKREFHVTLSNKGNGHPRASIGSPWEHQREAVLD